MLFALNARGFYFGWEERKKKTQRKKNKHQKWRKLFSFAITSTVEVYYAKKRRALRAFFALERNKKNSEN